MSPDLQAIFAKLQAASTRAKVSALLVVAAIVGVVSIAGTVASSPHFTLLYSELTDAESAAVQKALAEGGVRFKVSQPPAPFFVYVDESDYYAAQNSVAIAGALERAATGITTSDKGAGSVFMSSGERNQTVLKREWQELERQLEALDFVTRALVTTSVPDPSPLRRGEKMTASVVLQLRSGSDLNEDQARNIARIVRHRFNIPPENLVLSDQAGRSLYDPTGDGFGDGTSLIEYSTQYDRELARKANEALDFALGAGRAFVTVTSEWDHDRSTMISEVVDPVKVIVSEESSKTETPSGGSSGVGGTPGTGSNLIGDGFGVDNAGFATGPAAAPSEALATTKDDRKQYETGRSTTHRVRTAPTLQRLSVSLFLDESLNERQAELEEVVKAAVGFEDESPRRDAFQSIVTPLVSAEPVGEGEGEGGPAEDSAPSGPNPMVEMLLEYGVEIVAAIGFLVLLLRTLKSSAHDKAAGNAGGAGGPRGAGGSGAAAYGADGEELDPEALARAQVEELVRSDPERVGEILARWVREGETAESRA